MNHSFEWKPQGAYAAATLSWSWPEGSIRAGLRSLCRDLLAARRLGPPLRDRQHTAPRLVSAEDLRGVSNDESGTDRPDRSPSLPRGSCGGAHTLLVVERGTGASLLACANLTPADLPLTVDVAGRRAILSTEQPRYGGGRTLEARVERLAPYELILFALRGWRS